MIQAGSDRHPPSFLLLSSLPTDPIASSWRACLVGSDFATHYTAPEYFLEPSLRTKKPFAVLSVSGREVTAVLTGIHDGDRVQSGLSVRPQIAFSRFADRPNAIRNLVAGFLQEAATAKLADVFAWSDTVGLVDARFRQRRYDGVVMLDLVR